MNTEADIVELKRFEWNGWTIKKMEQHCSRNPRWVAVRNQKTNGVDTIQKGKLSTVKDCIAMVDRHDLIGKWK